MTTVVWSRNCSVVCYHGRDLRVVALVAYVAPVHNALTCALVVFMFVYEFVILLCVCVCVCAVCVSSDGLKAMGFKHPNAVLGKLKAGEVIVLPDGTRLDPDNDVYVTKTRPGRRMVFLGDTCDPYGMLDLARDCDLLVHEVSERGESSYNCLVHHWSVGLEAMGRNRL